MSEKCTRCGLYKTAQSVRLMGQGPKPCKYMVIGEAPGYREDDLNKPFQGDCGEELDRILSMAKVPRSKVYITNIVHCRPPKNRKPKKSEIKACKYWLQQELITVNPQFILLLGATALAGFEDYFKGKGTITSLRGKFYEVRKMFIMPTFHPGAVLRDERKRPILESDIIKFFDYAESGKQREEQSLNFRIAKGMADILRILAELKFEKYVSLDLETEGLSPFNPELNIRCIGLGLSKKQWIIPLNHPESPFKDKKTQQKIVSMLHGALSDKEIIAQNGKFDSLWLQMKYKLIFWIAHDTMMMSYLLDENNPHGLKYLANRFFGAPDYDIDTSEKTGTVSLERLSRYCALDVFYTRKLYFIFIKQLKSDSSLHRFYSKVIMPVINIYREIEKNGVYIDQNKMESTERILSLKVNKIKKKMKKYGDINWNSTQQISKLLFRDIGLNPLEFTDTGGFSTSESVLKRLTKVHELPQLILDYREANNLISKFITGWKELLVDGYLHPSFKIHGTVTGRPSCENPNLQQTPRDTRIRSLIIAPEGWDLVEFDYGQIELRIAAMLADDKAMKLAFQTGEDIHVKTAMIISDDVIDKSSPEFKEWRKKAKPVNFGLIYRMGADGLVIYARDKYDVILTRGEAVKFISNFFGTYRDFPRWHEKQIRIARINRQVRNLAGRIRHLPDIDVNWQAEAQAINSPVQGLASDFTLMSVIDIYNRYQNKNVKICGTVHDAVLALIRKEHTKKIVPEIIKMMESPSLFKDLDINPSVPIVVNASIGPWGKGEEWNG